MKLIYCNIMKRFYFRLYQCGDEDRDNVWTTANTKQEAEAKIRREYYSIDKLEFIRFE